MSTAYQPSTFYVLPNNFLTVLFKGRCRRGGVTLRFFNTMDSIIINLTYTQAPHSPLFPNPNCSKRNNETMNECMLLKSKTKLNINTPATCHLTETDVMFLHKRILLQQTSNTRNTRTLQETLKTSELKCQQLSGTRLVQIPRYRLQDNTKTRSSLATTFTHMSQTINLNQASLFTAIELELIQTCPPT